MKSVTHSIHGKQPRSAGFTLVEMLVVAPLVILMVGVIIGFITTITGDALTTNRRGAITYTAQQALDILERDIRLASNFLPTTGELEPEQRPSGAVEFEASEGYLVLEQNATSNNPYSDARELVYYNRQPNECGSNEEVNQTLRVKLVYFLDKPSGATRGTLYKRTIVPEYSSRYSNDVNSACASPWQVNSCTDGFNASSSSPCKVRDEQIATDIKDFTIQYFASAASSTPTSNPADATAVRIELETDSQAAGRFADFKGAIRATKLNPNENPLETPARPNVNFVLHEPGKVKFTWEVSDTTTFYDATYGINQSCNTTAFTNSRDDSFVPPGTQHGDTVYFCLTAKNIVGSSASNNKYATIALWDTTELKNGWYDRDVNGFGTFGFTKSVDGEVVAKGLIQNSASSVTSSNRIFATLPEGYRPSEFITLPATTFYANSEAHSHTTIRIYPSGNMYAQDNHTSTTWLSLANIHFMADGSCTWRSASLDSGWLGVSTPKSCIDGSGRAHTQGSVRPSSSSPGPSFNERIGALSTTENFTSSQGRLIFPSVYAGDFSTFDVSNDDLRNRSYNGSRMSLMAAYYTPSYSGTWRNLYLYPATGWDNYPNYAPAQYTKNGNIVTLQGLIWQGDAEDGEFIGWLSPGYRPGKNLILATVGYPGRQVRINIRPDGWIQLSDHGSATWLSLTGITFVAE